MRVKTALLAGGAAGLLLSAWLAGQQSAQAAEVAPPPAGIVDDPCAKTVEDVLRDVDIRQRDYGQLCRYRSDNAALKASARPVRVVFMGDSITEGWIKADPGLFRGGVVDRGISGQTTSQMLVRFRQDVIDLHPRAVHILAGTNDIAGNTGPTTLAAVEGNIVTMAELARAHGIRVIIGAVLPASRYPWRPEVRSAEQVRKLNNFLSAYARRSGFDFVDYHAPLANAEGGMDAAYAADGIHPTAAGYGVMGRLARRAVDRIKR